MRVCRLRSESLVDSTHLNSKAWVESTHKNPERVARLKTKLNFSSSEAWEIIRKLSCEIKSTTRPMFTLSLFLFKLSWILLWRLLCSPLSNSPHSIRYTFTAASQSPGISWAPDTTSQRAGGLWWPVMRGGFTSERELRPPAVSHLDLRDTRSLPRPVGKSARCPTAYKYSWHRPDEKRDYLSGGNLLSRSGTLHCTVMHTYRPKWLREPV